MSSGNTAHNNSPIATMFDNISPRYDFLNHLLSINIDKTWRRRTVEALVQHHPKRILDIATGTADLALLIAKKLPSAQIVGLDLSEKMLEIGREKIAKQDLESQISLQQGDAAHLTFPDNTFDSVTIAFGARNFEHLSDSLREIRRVMAPGGRLFILEFSMPTTFPIKQIYRLYFLRLLPSIGSWISKDKAAYSYLPTSVQNFPPPSLFMKIIADNDFRQVEKTPFSFGIATLYSAIK